MDVIVAANIDWGIGYEGTQPLVVPEDRKHFQALTRGGTIIVGRRTLADFPGGRPLKNRRNIIISANPFLSVEGAEVAHSAKEALELTRDDEKVFLCGGASVYKMLLPCCERAYVTRILAEAPADRFFPDLEAVEDWSLAGQSEELASESGVRYRFETYVNRRKEPDNG